MSIFNFDFKLMGVELILYTKLVSLDDGGSVNYFCDAPDFLAKVQPSCKFPHRKAPNCFVYRRQATIISRSGGGNIERQLAVPLPAKNALPKN